MENENAKPKKKFYKKWWFYAIIVFVAIVIIAPIAASGNDKKSYELTISNSYQTQTVSAAGGFLTESTTEMFVVVTFSIKNLTSDEATIFSSDVKLNVDGSNYTYHTGATLTIGDPILAKSIGAGITKTLTLVFEIPRAKVSEPMKLNFKSLTANLPTR